MLDGNYESDKSVLRQLGPCGIQNSPPQEKSLIKPF